MFFDLNNGKELLMDIFFSVITWIIHASRLVQMQAALNEAVCVLLRIQGSLHLH